MKLWRPGITGKLFLAIFATCIVLLISMHWAVRISFERGFIDYIKRGNEQRLTMLGDALSEQYEQHGDWKFCATTIVLSSSYCAPSSAITTNVHRVGRARMASQGQCPVLARGPICRRTAGARNFGLSINKGACW